MTLLLLLLLLLATPLDCCDPASGLCLALWHDRVPPDRDEAVPVFLGKDEASGCFCKEEPGKLIVCFGREMCVRFPKDVEVRSDSFRVKTTFMEALTVGDMEKMGHLKTLEFEGNERFRTIEEGVFANMSNLRNLSISYNKRLENLQEGVFEGLVNLQYLYMIQNGFTSIKDITPSLSPNYLPNIYKISLSENLFREVQEDDFLPMEGTPLEELNLVLCQIEYLHPKCLGPLKNLTALRLGENVFNASTVADVVESSVEMGIPLRLLNLYSVGLRIEPPRKLIRAIAKSNVTNLSLARNQFELLKGNAFSEMPNIEVLDLREVLALNISNDTFINVPNLRTLLLSGNKLSFVPDGVLLKQLTYLDLSHNSGNIFMSSYFLLRKKGFVGMTNLKVLNLSFNRINGIINETFVGLTNLAVLGLKNCSLFFIGNDSFASLPNLKFLDLENNPFGATITLKKETFRGLENLEVLLLAGCSISQLNSPFEYLKSLVHLGLERNHLYLLSPETFLPLTNLKGIDISRNSLVSWQKNVFHRNTNLTRVYASHNKFTYLSRSMLDDWKNLEVLSLGENPFSCDCSGYTTQITNSTLRILEGSSAFCVYPDAQANLTVYEYYLALQESSGPCDAPMILAVIVPSLVFLFFVVGSAVLLYRFRWHVRYWIFLARLHLSRTGRLRTSDRPRSCTNYQFDAFVSYCNEDRNFVIRLVAMLENYQPYLKLCVYERDFQVRICWLQFFNVVLSNKKFMCNC